MTPGNFHTAKMETPEILVMLDNIYVSERNVSFHVGQQNLDRFWIVVCTCSTDKSTLLQKGERYIFPLTFCTTNDTFFY